MARRATIQLKVHRQIVQSIPLDDADLECLIQPPTTVVLCGPAYDMFLGASFRGRCTENARHGNDTKNFSHLARNDCERELAEKSLGPVGHVPHLIAPVVASEDERRPVMNRKYLAVR